MTEIQFALSYRQSLQVFKSSKNSVSLNITILAQENSTKKEDISQFKFANWVDQLFLHLLPRTAQQSHKS